MPKMSLIYKKRGATKQMERKNARVRQKDWRKK
jgi:hypothetical protein